MTDSRPGQWISPLPLCSIAACLVAVLSTMLTAGVLYRYQWTPLQRFYLKAYLFSAAAADVGLWPGRYTMVYAVTPPSGNRLARNSDVVDVTTRTGSVVLAPSFQASKRGVEYLQARDSRPIAHAIVYADLRNGVYGGRTVGWLIAPAAIFGASVLVAGLLWAVPADQARARERREGRRLRGTVTTTDVRAFNRQVCPEQSDADLVIAQRKGQDVRIPAYLHTLHTSICGATGSGKSAATMQILQQIRKWGHPAVVLDPHLTYTPRFHRDGDTIINAMDARMPYWAPGLELRPGRERAEALTIAEALVPRRSQEFFTDGTRRIVANLLERYPCADVSDLTRWITNGDMLDARISQEVQHFAPVDAPAQRAGILGSLGFVADSLRLLPTRDEAGGAVWTATDWIDRPDGWIFLTSTAATRARMVPIHSVILDTLILRCMDESRPRPLLPIWFILDEVQTLNRLPQLMVLMTESRKYEARVVLGFQGTAQIHEQYGDNDAKTILGNASTQITLRTLEADAAAHASKAIGEVEIERIVASRRDGWALRGNSTTYTPHIERSPAVMASQLKGLPDLEGYLTIGEHALRFTIAYPQIPDDRIGFVARDVAVDPTVETDTETETETTELPMLLE